MPLNKRLLRYLTKMTWDKKKVTFEPTPQFFDEVGSTSDLAKEAGEAGKVAFSCFCADKQNKGRGRQGRAWFTLGEESLAFSFVVYEASYVLPHVVSISLVKVLRKLTSVNVQIKWPNDLVVNGQKMCGILVEKYQGEKPFFVVGIGINLLEPSDEKKAALKEVGGTSLGLHEKLSLSREEFLNAFLFQLEEDIQRLNKVGFVAFKGIYNEYSATLGKEIVARTLTEETQGIAQELTDRGSLILKTESGLKEILAAETIMEKSL